MDIATSRLNCPRGQISETSEMHNKVEGRDLGDLATNDITDKMTKIHQTNWFFLNSSCLFSNIVGFFYTKLDYS